MISQFSRNFPQLDVPPPPSHFESWLQANVGGRYGEPLQLQLQRREMFSLFAHLSWYVQTRTQDNAVVTWVCKPVRSIRMSGRCASVFFWLRGPGTWSWVPRGMVVHTRYGTPQVMHGVRQMLFGDEPGVGEVALVQYRHGGRSSILVRTRPQRQGGYPPSTDPKMGVQNNGFCGRRRFCFRHTAGGSSGWFPLFPGGLWMVPLISWWALNGCSYTLVGFGWLSLDYLLYFLVRLWMAVISW